MGEIDIEFRANSRQRSISGVKQRVRAEIIRRPEPFALEYSPQSFGQVQMRAIRRKEKEEQTSFLPYRPEFLEQLPSVYACVVENHKGVFVDAHGHPIKEVGDFVGCNAFTCGKAFIAVVSVDHPEYVESVAFLRRDKDILVAELPAVRHVSFSADMALVAEIQVDESVFCLIFEFLQLLGLIRIELRRGLPLRTFSYTSISRANADKKALNVLSLASFPVACCQASFAFLRLCLSCSIALRTASLSEQSIIGLRPRPGRVSKPFMPSASKRLTHELTDIWVISVCAPTSFDVNPFAFRSITRQRIRYAWLLPLRKPSSSCRRCLSVSSITLIFAIVVSPYFFTQRYEKILR